MSTGSQQESEDAQANLQSSAQLPSYPLLPPQHPMDGDSHYQPNLNQTVCYNHNPNIVGPATNTIQGGGTGAEIHQVVYYQPGQIPIQIVVNDNQRPPDYLYASVLSCIFCCWPAGCAAIYFACLANHLADNKHMRDARIMSNWSRNMFLISVLLGLIVITFLIVYVNVITKSNSY